MREIKKKEFIKLKSITQVIFTKDLHKSFYLKKSDLLTNLLKPRGANMTSTKKTNMQNKNCFIYYKSSHIFKECS